MKTPPGAVWLESQRAALLSSVLLLASACNLDNPGISPPKGQISYPAGLGLARDANGMPTRLLVANSNFDLKYNSATVQAFDLGVLDALIGTADKSSIYSCFFLATDEAGEVVDGGAFVDNTIYPDASSPADGGIGDGGLEAGVGGDAGADAAAGDAGALADAAVAVDLDASLGDSGADLDGSTMAGRSQIVLPDTRDFGSQRGILCDGRDGSYTSPDGILISRQAQCCFPRDVLIDADKKGVDGRPIFVNELLIDSYAEGMAVTPENRLYVAIRSKNRLVYMDADPAGGVSCNGQGEKDPCTQGASEKSKDDTTGATFPSAPVALVAGKLKDLGFTPTDATDPGVGGNLPSGLNPENTFVATSHELGQVSLFVDVGNGPVLQDVLTGGPRFPTSISTAFASSASSEDPATKLLYVTSAWDRAIGVSRVGARVRPYIEPNGEQHPAIQLYNSSPLILTGLASTFDLRSLVVDPVDPSRLAVLIGGTQQSVAFVHLDSSLQGEVRTHYELVVGNGPSKLSTAILDERRFVFASCYDEGSIYIFDLESEAKVAELNSQVLGLSGPFSMVVDEERSLMYVADFGASVVRVVDLSGILSDENPPPRIVATLGALTFPERLQ